MIDTELEAELILQLATWAWLGRKAAIELRCGQLPPARRRVETGLTSESPFGR